jgi:peroxin-4
MKELRDVETSGEFNIRGIDEDLNRLSASIRGPPESPYAGGSFSLELHIPPEYPLTPPKAAFLTRIFHPNVDSRTGEVCLDVLKTDWSPAWGVVTICRAIMALLDSPNADSPLNCDAGNLIRSGDMIAFYSVARMYTLEYAQS